MKANAGCRYRLYPTPRQAERLTGWGHTCRAVWNVALAQRRFVYAQRGITLRAARQCRQLTEARAELDWLADLPAQSAQQVLGHLDRAYDNWWSPEHAAGPPTFKKRNKAMSVPFSGQSVTLRKVSRKWGQVWLPKLGWVRLRLSRPLKGSLRNATVSRDALGWHVSFGLATGRIACGYQAHADRNAAQNIETLAAGRAVHSTRSHPVVARPIRHMREPLVVTSA